MPARRAPDCVRLDARGRAEQAFQLAAKMAPQDGGSALVGVVESVLGGKR